MEQKDSTIWSVTTYITTIPQWLSFEPRDVLQVGLLFWNFFRFSSFSVTVDTNVKKAVASESVTSAVLRIT